MIREDPVKRGLLYAGTERGVWVSFDDGARWQSLQRNLPPVPVHDLTIKDGDLIAATHGRAFWVIDDLSALRQLSPAIIAKGAHLTSRVTRTGSTGVAASVVAEAEGAAERRARTRRRARRSTTTSRERTRSSRSTSSMRRAR